MGNQQSSAVEQVWDGLQMSYPSTHSSIHSSSATFMPSTHKHAHKHAHKGVQSSFWQLQIQTSKVNEDLSEKVCADKEVCSLLVTKKITFPRFKVSEEEAGTGDDTAVQRKLANELKAMVSNGEGEAMKEGKLGNWEDGSKGTRGGEYDNNDYTQGVYLGRRKTQDGIIPTQISQDRQKDGQGLTHKLVGSENYGVSGLNQLKESIAGDGLDVALKEQMGYPEDSQAQQDACLQKFKSKFPLSVDCFL